MIFAEGACEEDALDLLLLGSYLSSQYLPPAAILPLTCMGRQGEVNPAGEDLYVEESWSSGL